MLWGISDKEFEDYYRTKGPRWISRQIKINRKSIQQRRDELEKKTGRKIRAEERITMAGHRLPPDDLEYYIAEPIGRLLHTVKNGVVLIGSDAHYWPGVITAAHKAFVQFCKELKPTIVIKNGDELDGASISRHPPIGWERHPTLVEEIECVKERLEEIRLAAPKGTKLYWPAGNHDMRFEMRLATVAPEYAKINGIHLKDHFPWWEPCWSVWINNEVVVKHRYKSGIHAPWNNAITAGKTIITGHLHSLKVYPVTDYNGTRWGVDCGTLSEPFGPQFNYAEDNPRNQRSGFVVLTFVDGMMLQPETVRVIDNDRVDFRGKIVRIK